MGRSRKLGSFCGSNSGSLKLGSGSWCGLRSFYELYLSKKSDPKKKIQFFVEIRIFHLHPDSWPGSQMSKKIWIPDLESNLPTSSRLSSDNVKEGRTRTAAAAPDHISISFNSRGSVQIVGEDLVEYRGLRWWSLRFCPVINELTHQASLFVPRWLLTILGMYRPGSSGYIEAGC